MTDCSRRTALTALLCVGTVTVLGGCSSDADVGGPAATSSSARRSASKAALKRVVVATGFKPDVMYTPYYVAQKLGHYARCGLDVSFNYDRLPNLPQLIASGKYPVGIQSGDAVAIAVANGAKLRYVMSQYEKYPVGAMQLESSNPAITQPQDLKGMKIGYSEPNGSTEFGLDVLLAAAGLSKSDVEDLAIGFDETYALVSGKIDVAMTYTDNEPTQARALGYKVRVLESADFQNLASNGVVVGERLADEDPGQVRAFVAASIDGLTYTRAHPDDAFEIALEFIPDLVDQKSKDVARKVLTSRLRYQDPLPGKPLGWSSDATWARTVKFLKTQGVVSRDARIDEIATNQYLPSH